MAESKTVEGMTRLGDLELEGSRNRGVPGTLSMGHPMPRCQCEQPGGRVGPQDTPDPAEGGAAAAGGVVLLALVDALEAASRLSSS